ncbi:MAG TPA: signal recognition particle-docking protein FtsY [Syntrophobacteraceae bacterium]|nr:signal recognition particle-docking protein FtsY [Syntrophobacteraceae bacterium]
MIRWFKRKKKKYHEKEADDIGQNRTVDEEEPVEEPEERVRSLEESHRPPSEQSPAQTEEELPAETETEPETVADTGEDGALEEVGEEEREETGEVLEGGLPGKKGFFRRLRQRLKGTREKFVHRIDRLVLGKRIIDDDLLDELEEILITSDLGVRTTGMLLRKVADKVKRKELSDPARLREQIRDEITSVLSVEAPPLDYSTHKPFAVMIVGVNGTGKTTTTGKLAHQLKQAGLKPMLAACDTFRAAAVEQLSIWGERTGVPVVKQKSGSDPSAVAFDALEAAVSRDIDVVLMDTAGRMHTKVNLMEELKKIHRVLGRKIPGAPHEVFLVLDASTGQNALSQAKLFKEGIGLTGLILTKLDGTAKGGIIAAICDELQVPVRYIGIGEDIDDLRPFDPEEFTNALF